MNEGILINGANTGIGEESARQLALKGETKKVILHCMRTHRYKTALPP
jgi:short-subunit dehydrogenase